MSHSLLAVVVFNKKQRSFTWSILLSIRSFETPDNARKATTVRELLVFCSECRDQVLKKKLGRRKQGVISAQHQCAVGNIYEYMPVTFCETGCGMEIQNVLLQVHRSRDVLKHSKPCISTEISQKLQM